MLDFENDVKGIARHNRDGSRMTQAQREQKLRAIGRELDQMGYRHLRARGLKPKHVEALIAKWQAEGMSAGTIKNRMSAMRWLCRHVGRDGVIEKSNDAYGIEHRVYVTNDSKARTITAEQLSQLKDPRVAISLRLQDQFGLRREESIKIVPAWADRGDRLVLKGSWTKGGRPREIPIRTSEQRAVLKAARDLAAGGSLIPREDRYIDQRRSYDRETTRIGLRGHGLRHGYAQRRYRELTGWEPPALGGPAVKHLTPAQRESDARARQQISRELGHERPRITAVYLGGG
jgi:integrase